MKKIYFLICYAAACLCTACDDGKIKVKGENGTEYESYQECCAAQDFEAAHRYLAKMENDQSYNLDEAKDFVFKQEALFLMSIGDETAKKRIIYLLKEEGGNDEHINMLIDIAIDNDDEEFVKSLTKQYIGAPPQDVLRKIVQYLYFEKSDTNLDFVTELLNHYDRGGLLLEIVAEKGDEELLLSLAQSYKRELSLRNEKLLTALACTRDRNISEKLIALLSENDIPSQPALGMLKVEYGDLDPTYDSYINAVKKYNTDCVTLLNIAIKAKNQYLAQRVLPRLKSNISYSDIGDWAHVVQKREDWNTIFRAFKITIDNTEKESAKANYQEAVSSGAFK